MLLKVFFICWCTKDLYSSFAATFLSVVFLYFYLSTFFFNFVFMLLVLSLFLLFLHVMCSLFPFFFMSCVLYFPFSFARPPLRHPGRMCARKLFNLATDALFYLCLFLAVLDVMLYYVFGMNCR